MTTSFDYDRNPERFRLATRVTRQYLTSAQSLYDHLAELLVGVRVMRLLDIGCGEGALRAALPTQLPTQLQARLVGLDASATLLRAHPPPVVQANAAALRSPPTSSTPPWPSTSSTISPSRPSRSTKPIVSWSPEGSSSLPPGAATTRRSWPTSSGPRPPASTPRTHPAWWHRSSGRCRSSHGMRRWSGCPTATRSATT
jgi:hypothetical protein